MGTHITGATRWSTSSFGDAADTSPVELSALGNHLNLCRGARGRLFTLHCIAEITNRFVAPRFVTTLVVIGLAIGLGSLVL